MDESKPCQHCGKLILGGRHMPPSTFRRRKFCCTRCQHEWRKVNEPAVMVPCRICGKPTRYHGSSKSPLVGKVPCEDPACVEESHRLKNDAIGSRARQMYADGSRQKIRHAWENVKRVSPEEDLLKPWFVGLGWVDQQRVLTGVHTNKLPRQFHLDFALPERKLYVEIDGKVHRLRKDRDLRRDSMLEELGWRGLRLPAQAVSIDLEAAKEAIATWINAQC